MQLKMYERSIQEVCCSSCRAEGWNERLQITSSYVALRQDQLHLSPSLNCLLNLSVDVSSEKFSNFSDICSSEHIVGFFFECLNLSFLCSELNYFFFSCHCEHREQSTAVLITCLLLEDCYASVPDSSLFLFLSFIFVSLNEPSSFNLSLSALFP